MKPMTVLVALFVAFLNVYLFADDKPGFERLVVQRSNGNGVQETYEVTPDGKYKFSDVKGARATGQIAGDELKSFSNAVNAIDWAQLPKNKPAQGPARFQADRFQFSVAIVVNKKFYNLGFHESGYADDEKMQGFIAAIAQLKK